MYNQLQRAQSWWWYMPFLDFWSIITIFQLKYSRYKCLLIGKIRFICMIFEWSVGCLLLCNSTTIFQQWLYKNKNNTKWKILTESTKTFAKINNLFTHITNYIALLSPLLIYVAYKHSILRNVSYWGRRYDHVSLYSQY